MVCNRCKMVVRNELFKLGLHPVSVNLGEIDLEEEVLTTAQTADIDAVLKPLGFELIDDRKAVSLKR